MTVKFDNEIFSLEKLYINDELRKICILMMNLEKLYINVELRKRNCI